MKKKRRQKKGRRPSAASTTSGTAKPIPINPVGMLLHPEQRKLYVFSADMLLNQLRRDGPKIEASFDALCEKELQELSALQSRTSALLLSGLHGVRRSELEVACAELLSNAGNSFCSAVALLRLGYVLQPGIIIRSLLEAVSMVLHLLQRPEDFTAYKNHSLQSPKTIASAKKALPPFGNLYGYFSDNFAHIGHLHKSVTPLREFKEYNEALDLNLYFLRMAAWLLYATTELLFNDLLDAPRYWKPVDGGCAWGPSEIERAWMTQFFNLDADRQP